MKTVIGKDSILDRRLFISGLAASLPSIALATPPTTATRPLLRNVENIRQVSASSARYLDPALANVTGFVLLDTSTGQVVDAHQPNLKLPPASVTKAITAIYARDTLGPDFRFTTRVMATGPVQNGLIQGDLYLVGGGDPALDTDELAGLSRAMVAQGIRGITGRYYVDNSALPSIDQLDPTQASHLGYNPTISGLNLNFNRVYFEWKQVEGRYRTSLEARSDNYRPAVKWMDISIANRDLPVYQHAVINGHDHWSVAQNALGAEGGVWLPVRQPADYVGEVFATLAARAGLTLPAHAHGNVPRGAAEVVRFNSEHMDEVLRWLLKYSNNLTAECIGLAASQRLGANPSSLNQSSTHMERWATANLGGARPNFDNHSGLSDKAEVSSMDMVTMLGNNRAWSHLSHILKPFVVTDNSGNAMDLGRRVIAKTGSMNFIRGLAGYLEKNGRQYAFAIFAADLQTRRSLASSQRDQPRGARTWSAKARRQQQVLLRHWLANI